LDGKILEILNQMSRASIGYKDVVKSESIRRNGHWDIKYTLDRNWLQFIRESQ